MIVLDYEIQPAPFSVMQLHGVAGAVVYVAPAAWNYSKAVTPDQLARAAASKFPLALNFEQNINDYLGGAARGLIHGQAIKQALAELAVSATDPCYLSIDTSVPAANFPLAAEYFAAARSAAGRALDLYGTTALAEYLAGRGLIKRHWRSASHAYYGNAQTGPHTALDQVGPQVPGLGGSYDVNTVLQDDWGQIGRTLVPTPPPAPTHGDEVSFYQVVDAPDKISPHAIFEKAGPFTRLMANPTDLQVNQWLAAVDGTQNVATISKVPYASHLRFWGAPLTVSEAQALGTAEAPEPAPQVHITVTQTP